MSQDLFERYRVDSLKFDLVDDVSSLKTVTILLDRTDDPAGCPMTTGGLAAEL